jgi:predicted NACHT family NTPase
LNNREITANDVDEVLMISNFIIIKGTGGIGKSTLMKHFFLNELEKNNLIPIFIELKDLENDDDTLYKSIFLSLEKLGFKLEDKYFEYALNAGCFLFLLDGYDEIPSMRVKKFIKEFKYFCDKYSNNYFIMSTRPNDDFISFQRFTVLNSLPLTKKQAISLISKINIDYLAEAKNGL